MLICSPFLLWYPSLPSPNNIKMYATTCHILQLVRNVALLAMPKLFLLISQYYFALCSLQMKLKVYCRNADAPGKVSLLKNMNSDV